MTLSKISSFSLISLLVLINLSFFIPSSSAQNSIRDYLEVHNAARAQVGVGPMRWDTELADYAFDYANRQKSKMNCPDNIGHSGGPYGENMAAGRGASNFTARQAVSSWVREKRYYDYDSNSCIGGVCRNYTQVVWRSSVRVGCARVKCSGSNWWYVICCYKPKGNVRGRWPY